MKEIINTLRGRRLRETTSHMRDSKKRTTIFTIDGGGEHPHDYKYDIYLALTYTHRGMEQHSQIDLTKAHLSSLLQGKKLMFNDLDKARSYSLIKED